MNNDAKLLNYIYQNSEMGVSTIKQLMDIVEDNNFKEILNSEYKEYKEINDKAKELLNSHGYDEKGINAFDKIRSYITINLDTMMDKSKEHISEMMIIGSTMGVIDAIKKIAEFKDVDSKILDLMKKLKEFEENNIHELKKQLTS